MPRVEEVFDSVGKACVISKFYLTKEYYQVPMSPPDIPNTAFTCYKRILEFLWMLFGVKNAQAVFRELMLGIFRKDSSFCSPYMDNLIVFS